MSVTPLALPQVTLCAVSSVNVAATVRALKVSLAQIDVAVCKLFTDTPIIVEHPHIEVVLVPSIASSAAYSHFVLTRLVDHVDTSHCLIVQWDGHVINAGHWEQDFLDYDYIGASWPQFADGHDVGNGGFSLRSRRLMLLCRAPEFCGSHPEDLAIGRNNRVWLETQGIRFAPRSVADRFSTERAGDLESSFGYHGVWHMPHAIGRGAFWNVYRSLNDKGTLRRDFATLFQQMRQGSGGAARALRMIWDRLRSSRLLKA